MSGLTYLAVEVSWGSRWVNINDGEAFKVAGDSLDTSTQSWRKVVAESPVLGGNYLVHAVPEMVAEQIAVWVYGVDQADLSDNFTLISDLFSQWDYRIRWTFDDYRETWRCQLADANYSRGQTLTHNLMAKASFTVPRYPEVTREQVL